MNILIGILALVTLINFLRAPKLFWLYMAWGVAIHIGIGLIFLIFGTGTSQVQTQGSEFEVWLFGGGMFIYGGACVFFNFVMMFSGLGDRIDEMAAEKDYKVQASLRGSRFQPGIDVVQGEVVEERMPLYARNPQTKNMLPSPQSHRRSIFDMFTPLHFPRTDCNCDKCGKFDWCDLVTWEGKEPIYHCDRCQGKSKVRSMHEA